MSKFENRLSRKLKEEAEKIVPKYQPFDTKMRKLRNKKSEFKNA